MPQKFISTQIYYKQGLSGITVVTVPDYNEVTAIDFLVTLSNVAGSPTGIGVKLSSGFVGSGANVNANIGSGGSQFFQDIGMIWYFSGNGSKLYRYQGACQQLRITATPIAGLTSYDLQILARIF